MVAASAEAEYRAALRAMLRELARFTAEVVVPVAERTARDMTQDAIDPLDGVMGLLRVAMERLIGTADAMVDRIIGLQEKRHRKRFAATVRSAIGIDVGAVIAQEDLSDEMDLANRRNVSLIRSLGEDTVKRIEQATYEAIAKGETAKQLSARLREEFGIAGRRADLIARDQTAKLNADLNRLRQVQAGIEEYEWMTSRDERVRASHREHEGKVYRWDDPPAGTGHPGEDINCRCVARAIVTL